MLYILIMLAYWFKASVLSQSHYCCCFLEIVCGGKKTFESSYKDWQELKISSSCIWLSSPPSCLSSPGGTLSAVTGGWLRVPLLGGASSLVLTLPLTLPPGRAPSPHCDACHGNEQRPRPHEAEPRFRQTNRQPHGHHGCHDDRWRWRFSRQRPEEWRGSAGRCSGQEDPCNAASPDRQEIVVAGERHLPVVGARRRIRAHFPSCGSQAHRRV